MNYKLLILFFFLLINLVYSQNTEYPINLQAESLNHTEEKITASGNVIFTYKNIKIKTENLEFNFKTQILKAFGNVAFYQDGGELLGKNLIYNLKTKTGSLYEASGFAKNLNFEKQFQEGKIFFWGKVIKIKPKEFNILDSIITTCDIMSPLYHYHLKSKEIIIYPEDKLIAKNFSFYIKDKPLIALPSLVLSLKQRSGRQMEQNLIPKIGYNDVDGYYLKESLNYLIGKKDYGIIHLNWYEKSGWGRGLEHYYNLGDKGKGAFYYYKLQSRQNNTNRFEYSNRLEYFFPGNINFFWGYSYNRYDIPNQGNPAITNNQLSLNKSGKKANFTIISNTYNSGYNVNQGYNFNYAYQFSPSLKGNFLLDYSENTSRFSKTFRSHPTFKLINAGKYLDAELNFENTTGTSLYAVSRKPEITLRSHIFNLATLPFQTSYSYGVYNEIPFNKKTLRHDFKFLLTDKSWQLYKNIYWNTSAGYDQLWYNNGEAKYIWRARSGIFTSYGPHIITYFDYNYQQPYGYSPLKQDQAGEYEQIGGNFQIYNQNFWQINTFTTYNIRTHNFQNLTYNLNFKPKRDWGINLGANYDIHKKIWYNLDAQCNLQITPDLNLQYWSVFDLQTGHNIYQDYALVKDWHCWEGRLIYRGGQQNEIWISLVLKGFSYPAPSIGVNQNSPIIPQNLWK